VQYTLKELAQLTDTELVGDENFVLTGINCLQEAEGTDISFLENPRYREALHTTKAGAVCVMPDVTLEKGCNYLITKSPSKTFQKIAEAFLGHKLINTGFTGIHETAVIHEMAEVGEGCTIGPFVVIDSGAKIGSGTTILSHAQIGPNVKIGENCLIYQSAVIREECKLGNRVIIQPGAVIGSCGYGYITNERGEHIKLAHMGCVTLEDDVEIGANTTIDRGRFKETRICRGSKIDNLVQLGHNVKIGNHNLIVSQTGIAGSTKTGNWVVLGGQVGVAGHIEIGDQVIVAAKGGVTKSVHKPGKYNGVPLQPVGEYNRHRVQLRRISSYEKRIAILEELINAAVAD